MKVKKSPNLIPFHVIESASRGDVMSINRIINHYSGYISALATRPFIDETGAVRMGIDPELQRRLETKLITKILTFNPA